MKVLRTIPSFFPDVTGPANQAWRISLELEKREISSPILTSDFGAEASPKEEIIKGVYVRRIHSVGRYMQYGFTPGVIPIFLQEDCDLIHAHSYRNFITDVGFLFSKIRSRPFLLHAHGTLIGYKKFLREELGYPYRLHDVLTFKTVAKRASALVVSTTQELRECAKFGVNKKRIHIIPVGIDSNDYDRIKKDKNTDARRILFVGRISRDRNIEQILHAFKNILKDFDVELLVVGGEARRSFAEKGGYLSELKTLARGLGIDKYVRFLGPLYGEDLLKAYRSSDIFVYTSLYENLGHTLLEAAASALPIVSTPVGIASDIIKDNETGFLVGYEVGELSEKLKLLLEDEGECVRLGKNARELVKREYRWDPIIDRYVELYQSLL